MQNNFFTGRTQLYKNRGDYNSEGIRTHVSIGDVYIENNVSVIINTSGFTYEYDDEDELKPLFRKVR